MKDEIKKKYPIVLRAWAARDMDGRGVAWFFWDKPVRCFQDWKIDPQSEQTEYKVASDVLGYNVPEIGESNCKEYIIIVENGKLPEDKKGFNFHFPISQEEDKIVIEGEKHNEILELSPKIYHNIKNRVSSRGHIIIIKRE